MGYVEHGHQEALLAGKELGWDMTQQDVASDWKDVMPAKQWPVVRFIVDGKSFIKTVVPVKMIVDDSDGTVICSRMQVPLILAYALTVHRAQGMTLDSLVLRLQGIFAVGQLYTALSCPRDFEKVRKSCRRDSARQCLTVC